MTEKRFEAETIPADPRASYVVGVFDNKTLINNFGVVRLLNELYEENKQLKAQLRKGEDVCDICKHQYLTKRDTDKYYIAKCKKEHIECSKGTVNYCKDFECKEETDND